MDESENDHVKIEELVEKHFKMMSNSKEIITYNIIEILGSGSFGIVFKVECTKTKEIFAIKKVLQDIRYKNRELQILKELNHSNVIKLKESFYTPSKTQQLYLNVVMEYIPETLSRIIRNNYKHKNEIPMLIIKKYAYQMLRAINYLHVLGICHRDIKPQNILIDPTNNILKLCDFGSAKKLIEGDVNVSYICSRYYRAPELIFGATEYNFSIDIWSVGCVIAELVLLQPLFPGENSIDQIVEIIKVLGTPTKITINKMNPLYKQYKFPAMRSFTWKETFKNKNVSDDFIELVSKLVVYNPSERLSPLEALTHPFFNELKLKIDSDETTPESLNLFEFTNEEIKADNKHIIDKLVPQWYKDYKECKMVNN